MPGVVPPVSPGFQEEGTTVSRRPSINFIGDNVTVTDNSAQNRTDVTITAGSGGGLPVLNVVTDYGAVGDWNGTTGTDNTTAIQNAINAAQAYTGGAIVYFPAGYYKITAALTLTKPVVLQGAQGGFSWQGNLVALGSVIVNAGTSTNAITISMTDGRPTTKLGAAWTIRDLAIDSTAASTAYAAYSSSSVGAIVGATAIDCSSNACGVLIENCFIARHATGINLCSDVFNYTADNEVRGTLVYMCRDYGIRMQNGIGNRIRFSNVRANWSAEWTTHAGGSNTHNGGYRGISMEAGDGHIIEGTEVISYQYGVYLASTNVKLTNVWADSCPNPYYSTGVFNVFNQCFGTACYDADGSATFPVGNAAFYVTGGHSQLIGCMGYRGLRGLDISGFYQIVTGCNFYMGDDAGSGAAGIRFIGATTGIAISACQFYGAYGVNYNLQTLTGSLTGNIVGGSSAAANGTRSSLILRGNTGLTDAG